MNEYELLGLLEKIKSTSIKKDVNKIIKENKDDEVFTETIKFLLGSNPTGVNKNKIEKNVKLTPNTTFKNLKEVYKYLEKNNTGRDIDIANLQFFIYSQNIEVQNFLKSLFSKTYKINIGVKTVNKALPGLIDTWEVQLGSGYDKLKLKDGEKFYISQKMNGTRGSHYEGKLISRQGKVYSGLQHIIDDLNKAGLSKYFVDGELIRKNVDNLSDGENFRIGTGIINSDAESKEEIKFVIFDLVPAEEYKSKKFTTKYSKRKQDLLLLQEKIKENNLQNIEIVPMFYEGTDQAQIMKWLDYAVEHGMEGCMLNKDKPYAAKRTTDLVKCKRFYEYDLEVVDVLEGDGRLKGTLGALVVAYKGNTVNVGSGYTDEDRAYLWAHKDELIGRVIAVKFKEETQDKKTGLYSLQFPIYVCTQPIGKEVSFN